MIIAEAVLCGCYVSLYLRVSSASHRRRSSMKIVKRKGESVSHCMVPLYMGVGRCLHVYGHVVGVRGGL